MGEIRMYRRVVYNNSTGLIKKCFHPICLFKTFARARVLNSVINSADEIEGFDVMDDHTQARIRKLIVAHKREGLPEHISRPKIRQVPGVGHEVGHQRKQTAYKKPSINVLYTNADELTREKVSELRVLTAREKPHVIAVTEVLPKMNKERAIQD